MANRPTKGNGKKSKKQHQDYNNVIQESLEETFQTLTLKVLKLERKNLINLKDRNLRRTLYRKPDMLLAEPGNGENFNRIFHIEVHLKDEEHIAYRAAEYAMMEFREFRCPVKIYVLYIGNGRAKHIHTRLDGGCVQAQIELVHINAIPVSVFLESEQPGEIILGILADFGSDETNAAIKKIVERLQKVAEDADNLQKYFKQLEILSNIRKLQPETVKQINAMPIVYDLKTDLRYQQGIEKGSSLKEREVVLNLWNMQMFSLDKIALAVGITEDEVRQILTAFLQEQGKTLEEAAAALVAYQELLSKEQASNN
jgi:hypothetical protein